MMKRCTLLMIACSILTASASTAFAQDSVVDPKTNPVVLPKEVTVVHIEDMDAMEARRGLDGVLAVTGSVNLVQNSSFVGQVDGFSTVFGFGLIGGLDYIHGRHEVRNTLTIDESFSRTPVLKAFVKNADKLTLNSQYNYFFLSWLGAYARIGFDTSILPTYDKRANKAKYEISKIEKDNTGKTTTTKHTVDSDEDNSFKLSGAFQPFSLYQSLGVISDPFKSDPFNLSVRVGIGGREGFYNGVILLTDDSATTDKVEAKELTNVFQFGSEAFVGVNGKFFDGRLTYNAGFNLFIPFVTNDLADRSVIDLMRWGLSAGVNFSVFSWMSLNYRLELLQDPQVNTDIQVQNSFLATFNYTFIERNKEPKIDEAALKIEAAEKEKAEAEKRAREAEEKLKAAEEKAREAEAKAAAANAAAQETAEKATDALNQAADQVENQGAQGGQGGADNAPQNGTTN